MVSKNKCTHYSQVKAIQPKSSVCEECVKQGLDWVALRKCLVCGNVGCCDSSAGHARKHFQETKHALITPLKGGWVWCYECDDYVE
ncbi:UBP-type zinc finger domain-containing protein [Candidatus Micrarchaeota archaeon]|nr:UBP-type zinc finger domain-containing protein [Candidatus Micrarchaeota archaeon]